MSGRTVEDIRQTSNATHLDYPHSRAVSDVKLLLAAIDHLREELETALDEQRGMEEEHKFGEMPLRRYEQYTTFVAVCARSGEKPDTFEDFCKKMASHWEHQQD